MTHDSDGQALRGAVADLVDIDRYAVALRDGRRGDNRRCSSGGCRGFRVVESGPRRKDAGARLVHIERDHIARRLRCAQRPDYACNRQVIGCIKIELPSPGCEGGAVARYLANEGFDRRRKCPVSVQVFLCAAVQCDGGEGACPISFQQASQRCCARPTIGYAKSISAREKRLKPAMEAVANDRTQRTERVVDVRNRHIGRDAHAIDVVIIAGG